MLVLRDIAIWRALPRLQMYLLSQQSKLALSAEAQRAVWAQKIISTIETTDPPSDIFAPSLKEILMDLPDPSPDYDFDKNIKKEMLRFFGEGAELSYRSFCQQRISRAKEASSRSAQQLTFVFCPNFLVTQPMFNLARSNKFSLISGCFGISKTISLVLYSNLLQPINQFYYKTTQNHALQEEKTALQEKSLLKKQSKYWYWSINWELIKNNGVTSVMDCLLDQAKELSKEEIASLKTIEDLQMFIKKLKSYYRSKDITSWIIIDQINGIASFMRKWNDFILEKGDLLEKMSSLSTEEQILLKEQLQSQRKINQYPAVILTNMFDIVKSLGMGYLLNSSINIETSLIQDPYKHANQFPASHTRYRKYRTLMLPLLEKHEEVVRTQIDYRQNLREKFGSCDFWHYFWFQVERRLLPRGISREKLGVAKRIFLLAASKAQVKGYFRNIYVFDCLKKNPLPLALNSIIEGLSTHLQEYFSLQEMQKMFYIPLMDKKDESSLDFKKKTDHPLQAYFIQYLKIFQDFCFTRQKERLSYFMEKGDTQKRQKILLILYSLAQRSYTHQEQFAYSIETLNKAFGDKIINLMQQQEYNLEILPIKISSQGKVSFEWTANEFMKFVGSFIAPNLFVDNYPFFCPSFIEFYTCHPIYRGTLFQLLLLYQLKNQATIVIHNFLRINLPFKIDSFYIAHCVGFKPINSLFNKQLDLSQIMLNEMILVNSEQLFHTDDVKKRSFFNVEENFQQLMESCNKNIGQYVSATPKYKGKHFFSSQCIDFIIAIKKDQVFQITSFDITVGTHGISKKINDAQDYLLRIASTKDNSFTFRHIILCPEESCRPEEKISQNTSIIFANVDTVSVNNPRHQSEYFIFRELQGVNVKIRKNLM